MNWRYNALFAVGLAAAVAACGVVNEKPKSDDDDGGSSDNTSASVNRFVSVKLPYRL